MISREKIAELRNFFNMGGALEIEEHGDTKQLCNEMLDTLEALWKVAEAANGAVQSDLFECWCVESLVCTKHQLKNALAALANTTSRSEGKGEGS